MRNYDLKRKVISFLLCFCILFSLMEPLGVYAEDTETVTVTVNYVYESNQAMVSQPYSAQIAKGAEFKKTIAAPKLLNYSVPVDKVVGLGSGISYSEDTDGNGTIVFELAEVTEDITVTLYYVAGTAKYKVNHYYQNLDNDEYTLGSSVEVQGDIDAYTEAVVESKEGFSCQGVPEYIIAADGSTVVNIYYNRNYYMAQFDVNEGMNGPEPIYGKYGTQYDAGAITAPTRPGYNFIGWNPAVTGTLTANVTHVAQWEAKDTNADYTIVLWGQNANDDDYSYLSSHAAFGETGTTATWNPNTLICKGGHVHTDDCYAYTCGYQEHGHSAECFQQVCGKEVHSHIDCSITCGQEYHVHGTGCYTDFGSKFESSFTEHYVKGAKVNGSIGESYFIYGFGESTTGNKYIYINGTWYKYTGAATVGTTVAATCGKTESTHTHIDSCYNCGLEAHNHSDYTGDCYQNICNLTAHTHTDACRNLTCGFEDDGHVHDSSCYMSALHPDDDLWKYVRCEEIVITADGTTVLNVYFDRVEYTITFKDNGSTIKTLTERWGANIDDEWPVVGTNGITYDSGQRWDPSNSSTIYKVVLVHLSIMPAESFTLTCDRANYDTFTMHYYVEVLPGGTGTHSYNGKQYVEAFSAVKANYNYVTKAEDFFDLEGYEQDTSNPSFDNTGQIDIRNGGDVYFYYARKQYELKFFSASNSISDKTALPYYQQNLSSFDYTPTAKPQTVEADAVFAGWYQNPQCTGEEYILSEHTMPANDIALYAKWVNRDYTVTTYLNAAGAKEKDVDALYTYAGYTGSQKVIKYETAVAPENPTESGKVFVGWFYDDNGTEKPFSFGMSITKDYDLYPKFSEQAMVNYTVHYYLEGTTKSVATDKNGTAMIGSSVTEKAKMGTDLDLVAEGTYNNYFPDKTSTSVTLNQENMEIIFYYTEAKNVPYTVKYVDSEGKEIAPSVNKTTSYSMVTETYQQIDGYTPRQFSITEELVANPGEGENVITFVYDKADTSLSVTKKGGSGENFVFTIKGTEDATSGIELTFTVASDETVIINDLPLGAYTITEDTAWAWRYSCTPGEMNVTLVGDAAQNQVTFTNTVVKEQWLGGEDYAHNWYGNSTN